MGKEQQKATWVFFMMAALRKRRGIVLPELVRLEKRYHIISFLMNHYELLHYYDNDYIVSDIENYIREQSDDVNELLQPGQSHVSVSRIERY
jgi:hypothetical protein